MTKRRAIISTDDLRRMAKVAAEFGVTVNGKIDALGNFTVRVAPSIGPAQNDGDDFDDRLADFASR